MILFIYLFLYLLLYLLLLFICKDISSFINNYLFLKNIYLLWQNKYDANSYNY